VAGRSGEAPLASGRLLVSREPLSLWGGYDQHSGEIIDRRHPLSGRDARGCILALPSSRGSSTTTAILLEAARNDTAPAAILTQGVDTFFTLASIVADEMYAKPVTIVALEKEQFERLQDGAWAEVSCSGKIRIGREPGAGIETG
jgi:predicted aconitase with swiveling domain